MAEFFEAATAAYEEVSRFSPHTLRNLVKMPGKLRKLLRLGAG